MRGAKLNSKLSMRYLDRTTSRLPQPWRTILDWAVTIAFAIAFILVFEAEVAKPYRIPSPSMEPTLHCARPAAFCLGSFSDRIIANRLAYTSATPGADRSWSSPRRRRRQSADRVTVARRSSSVLSACPARRSLSATARSSSTVRLLPSRMSIQRCATTRRERGRV